MAEVGQWGVYYLACDLPAQSPFLTAFRKAGFSIWARQMLFRFEPRSAAEAEGITWRRAAREDYPGIARVYRQLVPALFQPVEPAAHKLRNLLTAYTDGGELAGYAEMDAGPRGTWMQPFITSEYCDVNLVNALLAFAWEVADRPVYISARSYQPWLEEVLNRGNAAGCEEQVLLVRYLASKVKYPQTLTESIFESSGLERHAATTQLNEEGEHVHPGL